MCNAFISWSGGKDCLFALHTFLQQPGNRACCLVNFCEADSQKSRSHNLGSDLISAQAEAINIPLIQRPICDSYESELKGVIAELKNQGITAGVFGDIYLEEHRNWIERVCNEMGITALFPLWKKDTTLLLKAFVDNGFRAFVVAVRNEPHLEPLLGKVIDSALVDYIVSLKGVDPCGELGEYHTFVFDGPLFRSSVSFESGEIFRNGKRDTLFLPIHLNA